MKIIRQKSRTIILNSFLMVLGVKNIFNAKFFFQPFIGFI